MESRGSERAILNLETSVVVQASLSNDTISSTTWIPKRTITVKGDGAVFSRIMHIVTLAVL